MQQAQLVDAEYMNGVDAGTSVWARLERIPFLPAESLASNVRATEFSAPPSLPAADVSLQEMAPSVAHRGSVEVLEDDHSIMLTCALSDDLVPSDVKLAPYTTRWIDSPVTISATNSLWELPWTNGNKLHRRVIAKKVSYNAVIASSNADSLR